MAFRASLSSVSMARLSVSCTFDSVLAGSRETSVNQKIDTVNSGGPPAAQLTRVREPDASLFQILGIVSFYLAADSGLSVGNQRKPFLTPFRRRGLPL